MQKIMYKSISFKQLKQGGNQIKASQAKSNQLLFGAYFVPMTDIEATSSINQKHDPSSHANVPVGL
jgi:hypothetical protein